MKPSFCYFTRLTVNELCLVFRERALTSFIRLITKSYYQRSYLLPLSSLLIVDGCYIFIILTLERHKHKSTGQKKAFWNGEMDKKEPAMAQHESFLQRRILISGDPWAFRIAKTKVTVI